MTEQPEASAFILTLERHRVVSEKIFTDLQGLFEQRGINTTPGTFTKILTLDVESGDELPALEKLFSPTILVASEEAFAPGHEQSDIEDTKWQVIQGLMQKTKTNFSVLKHSVGDTIQHFQNTPEKPSFSLITRLNYFPTFPPPEQLLSFLQTTEPLLDGNGIVLLTFFEPEKEMIEILAKTKKISETAHPLDLHITIGYVSPEARKRKEIPFLGDSFLLAKRK